MARVVVIGGGFAGMAVAARLARLGHAVSLVEGTAVLGGALAPVTDQGFVWHGGPATLLLPAVVRDLFRKTGRPLERELDLHPVPVVREHRFDDGSVVALPGGSRAAQLHAVDALGDGLGRQWVDFVASLAGDWELVRRNHLERPWDPATAAPEAARLLGSRRRVHHRLHRDLTDPRLRTLAAHPLVALGQDPRRAPGWLAVWPYVEQRFGAWLPSGGQPALADALATRVRVRRVEVLLDARALDVVVRGGRAVAVRTVAGELDADVVVCAVDPRRLPTLAAHLHGVTAVPPPWTTHLGLAGTDADAPPELVLHGEPDLDVQIAAPSALAAPDGSAAWTVRAARPGDALALLAERGVDVRDRVVVRHDRAPAELAEGGGSPLGVRWRGRTTRHAPWGPRTPIPGVYAAGAHAVPGAGLPFVGLSAALVAQAVGAP